MQSVLAAVYAWLLASILQLKANVWHQKWLRVLNCAGNMGLLSRGQRNLCWCWRTFGRLCHIINSASNLTYGLDLSVFSCQSCCSNTDSPNIHSAPHSVYSPFTWSLIPVVEVIRDTDSTQSLVSRLDTVQVFTNLSLWTQGQTLTVHYCHTVSRAQLSPGPEGNETSPALDQPERLQPVCPPVSKDGLLNPLSASIMTSWVCLQPYDCTHSWMHSWTYSLQSTF